MRKTRRLIAALVLILLLLVLAFPYIAMVQPFRDMILRAVLPEINGTVTASRASLGWFSPIRFYDMEIRARGGRPVVSVPTFHGDRTLWRYIVSPSELGNFRIERPGVSVVVTDGGLNLREVFGLGGRRPQQPVSPPDVSLGLQIVDAGLFFRGRGATEPWQVTGFNLSLALEPSTATESGLTELVVRPGTVCDHTQVVPRMCDDLLKYIVPVLAEVTDVSGEFSLELDDWRLPRGDPHLGAGSGRLAIHSIDVGPGPLVRALAPLLDVPPSLRLAEGSVVQFALAEGRIHHRDLQFGLGEMTVRTHGSVGLDQSLELVAEIPIPTGLLPRRPLAEALKGRTLKLPITGTLSRPEIDPAALGASNLQTLLGTLGELLKNRPRDGEALLDRLLDPDRPRRRPLLDRLRRPLQQRSREKGDE